MKKATFLLFFLLVGVAFSGFAQTAAPADFFAGQWEITVVGPPNGDAKLVADLVRKDGKLTGTMTSPADPAGEKIVLTNITENGNQLGFAFVAQSYDVTVDLAKVDDDTLKGSLMSMFTATAKRVK
jgi:hypothetical protein